MSVEFVAFYADGGSRRTTVAGEIDGIEQINLLVQSAKRTNPGAKFTILSDQLTDLGPVADIARITRYDLDASKIMFERTRVQCEYLKQSALETPIVLTDTDVLLFDDISDLFSQDFDIGFTWRQSTEMPINAGLIYVNNKRKESVVSIFEEIVDVYRKKFFETADWYGDQFAIGSVIDLPFSEIYKSPVIERAGGKIALLPCNVYNFSPGGERPNVGLLEPGAKVYHFKGMSRRLMRLFWAIHLSEGAGSPLRRRASILYHNARLRLQRRSYKSQLKKDIKRFNCDAQLGAAWVDRGEIAASLIARTVKPERHITVADVGCGDQKLRAMLVKQGLPVIYRGYDLVPQDEDVTRFNLAKDQLPKTDTAIVLGVLEYIADIDRPLSMLARACEYLIVSHAVTDYRQMSSTALRRLNWKTQISAEEFTGKLRTAGFDVIDSRVTANQKCVIWICRTA